MSHTTLQALLGEQKMYTKEEKINLVNKFQSDPTPENATNIIRGYYKLIIKTAHKVKNTPCYKSNPMISIEDLVNAGIVGMRQGLPKIKTNLGTNIDSYIMQWTREYMYRQVREMYSPVRLPVGKLNTSRKIDKLIYKNNGQVDSAIDQYLEEQGVSSDKLNKRKKKLKKWHDSKISVDSIHFMVNEEESEQQLTDNGLNGLEHFQASETLTELKTILNSCLTDQEKHVINQHFDINGMGNTKSYQQIGDELGITRMRVCQIIKNSLKKMKNEAVNRDYSF